MTRHLFRKSFRPSYHEVDCLIENIMNYAPQKPPSRSEIGAMVYSDAADLFYPDEVHHNVRNTFIAAAESIWNRYRERRIEEMKASAESPMRDAVYEPGSDTVDSDFTRLVSVMKGAAEAAKTAGDMRTASLILKLAGEYEN